MFHQIDLVTWRGYLAGNMAQQTCQGGDRLIRLVPELHAKQFLDVADWHAAAHHQPAIRFAYDIRCRGLSRDRKSTRLNSSHSQISYAVFCLKKKEAQPRAGERYNQQNMPGGAQGMARLRTLKKPACAPYACFDGSLAGLGSLCAHACPL